MGSDAVDNAVMGENSRYQQRLQAAMEQGGLSREDAEKQLLLEDIRSAGSISPFVSGLMLHGADWGMRMLGDMDVISEAQRMAEEQNPKPYTDQDMEIARIMQDEAGSNPLGEKNDISIEDAAAKMAGANVKSTTVKKLNNETVKQRSDGTITSIPAFMQAQKQHSKEALNLYQSQTDEQVQAAFDQLDSESYVRIAEEAETMYTEGTTDEKVKAYLRDKPYRDYMQSDPILRTINPEHYARHDKNSGGYIDGRSYLTISQDEAQALVDQYAGKGYLPENPKYTSGLPKETVVTDHIIGVSVNPETGEETPTNAFKIHYSKSGVHIVPFIFKEE